MIIYKNKIFFYLIFFIKTETINVKKKSLIENQLNNLRILIKNYFDTFQQNKNTLNQTIHQQKKILSQ